MNDIVVEAINKLECAENFFGINVAIIRIATLFLAE